MFQMMGVFAEFERSMIVERYGPASSSVLAL
jgi:DNA invertase Pin-like site-specific DNA recombinase